MNEVNEIKALYIRAVPSELHKKFKAICAVNEESIQDAIIRLIMEAIENRKKEKKS